MIKHVKKKGGEASERMIRKEKKEKKRRGCLSDTCMSKDAKTDKPMSKECKDDR